MPERLYPESKVEVRGWEARHYDRLMDTITFGAYPRFIRDVVRRLELAPGDRVLDLGAGTGRNACLMVPYVGDAGRIVGWEVGREMRRRFEKQCGSIPNVSLEDRRIDLPARFDAPFDHVFISFVLHGLPHPSRREVIANARRALRPGGRFHLLDYTPGDPDDSPFYRRWFFRYGECPLATDFVRRDINTLLAEAGFGDFRETRYFWGIVRLLTATRTEDRRSGDGNE